MFKNFKQPLNIITTLSALFLMGCQAENSNSPKSSQPKIKLHELGIETDKTQLNTNQKKLLSQIENKKNVDQDLLFEIILEMHKQDFLKNQQHSSTAIDKNPLITYFDPLLDSVSNEANPHDFKVGYEKNLLALHNQEALKYNRDYTSVFSALFANRMQCYSGTMLFSLIYARLKKSAYFDSNQVFIYEDGHVLPGYMLKMEGQWHLFGVETTLNGKAKKIYGSTSGLQGVRVVDAHVALGIEALKDRITNKAFVVKTALEKTAKLYDIPLDQTEGSLSNVRIPINGSIGSNAAIENTSAYLDASLFGFGDSSHVPQGDLMRETVDEFIAKPKGSGKNILINPNNWNRQTETHRNQPAPGPQATSTPPSPPSSSSSTPDAQIMTNKEQLKIRINQDLILNEDLSEIKDTLDLSTGYLFLFFHRIDVPSYYKNSKCILNNINKMFPHLDGPNAYSKKDLKTGEVFNVLGYEVNWESKYRQYLTLYMASETSELYLSINCFGDDIENLQAYRDLEELLDGVISFEEKRNSIIDDSVDKSEGHPPFLFYPSSTWITGPRLLDTEKGLGSKKIEVHADLQLVQDSLFQDKSNNTINARYFFENEECSLLVKERKSMEENHNTNRYNEFYVSSIDLRQGKGFSLDSYKKDISLDPYNYTLRVYAKTKDYDSLGKKDPKASLLIECTSKYWTLSTSQNDIEELLDGVVSFVEDESDIPL